MMNIVIPQIIKKVYKRIITTWHKADKINSKKQDIKDREYLVIAVSSSVSVIVSIMINSYLGKKIISFWTLVVYTILLTAIILTMVYVFFYILQKLPVLMDFFKILYRKTVKRYK